jgi:hypothetical protein
MKNFLIGVLVVAVIVLGYLAFKPKAEVTVSPISVTPSGQTTAVNNSNGKDYQPNTQKKTYNTANLTFSYDGSVFTSPTTNPKGGVVLSKDLNDPKKEIVFYAPVMSSSFDPAYANPNVKVEALTIGSNKFDVYTTDSAKIYILATNSGGVVSITTPLSGASYTDLGSIKAK